MRSASGTVQRPRSRPWIPGDKTRRVPSRVRSDSLGPQSRDRIDPRSTYGGHEIGHHRNGKQHQDGAAKGHRVGGTNAVKHRAQGPRHSQTGNHSDPGTDENQSHTLPEH